MELEEEVGVMHRRSPCGRFVDIPDVYRGRYREDDPDAAAKYAAEVEQKILRVEQKVRSFQLITVGSGCARTVLGWGSHHLVFCVGNRVARYRHSWQNPSWG